MRFMGSAPAAVTARFLTAAALILALGAGTAAAAGVAGEVTADTIWEGTVEVTGEVIVADGATLLVQPGTTVRFAPGQDEQGQPRARILVHGTLIAQGSAGAQIRFISAAISPQPGDWGGIAFEHSQRAASRLSHAEIRHATAGISGASATVVGQDLVIGECLTGVWARQELNGQLLRCSVSGNESGVYFHQNSGLAIDDCLIVGNTQVGLYCHLGSSPAIRNSLIADNGARGITCVQGSSPLIEGNTIRGHQAGIYMELQVHARVRRNLITGNETGIWGEKMTAPEILGNVITGNGTGVYCNYSTYPVIHGNNIHENRSFAVVLGDNMSILMEEKIPFRHLGAAYFGAKPPEAAALPPQTRKLQSFARGEGGVVDARGNWWGAAATEEMARLPPDGNSSVIEDFFDKPDTFHEGVVYRRDRVAFAPWEPAPIPDAGLPAKPYATIRGTITADGRPVAGARVHAYPDAASGLRGEGATYSPPSAADGSFSLDIRAGSWHLAAKSPMPPFPANDPGPGELEGPFAGNPVAVAPGASATVEIGVTAKPPDAPAADGPDVK